MATSVALSEAREHLSELLDRVETGEEILIKREGRTAMRLVPVPPTEQVAGKRIFGQNLLGITYIAPDFDEPMSEEDFKQWDTEACDCSWTRTAPQPYCSDTKRD